MSRQYLVFFTIGVIVTALTVLCRAMLGTLVEDDATFYYALTIGISYLFGILLSYLLHKRVTFAKARRGKLSIEFFRFVFVSIFGMVMCMLVAQLLRAVVFNQFFGQELSKSAAFAFAAFLTSFATYILNKLFVFTSVATES